MERKGFKLMLRLLMTVFIVLLSGTTVSYAAEYKDNRTCINRVDIKTNKGVIFGYGKSTALSSDIVLNQTTKEPVRISSYCEKWERYVDGEWVTDCDTFISGQWRMLIYIEVCNNSTHLLDNKTEVFVDGEKWKVWDGYNSAFSDDYIVVCPSEDSTNFYIEEPAELRFHKLKKYGISGQRVNSLTDPFSVASSVEGGIKPYSFRKVSGPDWLEVSVEGAVSGTPTETGSNKPLVVEVLDSKGGAKQISIEVGETLEENVIEVSSWEELNSAFYTLFENNAKSRMKPEYLTIRLMEDLSSVVTNLGGYSESVHTFMVYRAFVTFDFNGHTLSYIDDESSRESEEYDIGEFILIDLFSETTEVKSSIRFIDSVGGGGITMHSKRANDSGELAALYIWSRDNSYYVDHQVYFDGGEYVLNSEVNEVGYGTLNEDVKYRSCVIANKVRVEINDGYFGATEINYDSTTGHLRGREITAFGTCISGTTNASLPIESLTGWDRVVINGGIFESNGYAVHHFDNSFGELNSTNYMLFPVINGGYFIGQMGYTGHTFTDSEGNDRYNNLPATFVISENAYVVGVDADGNKFYDLNGKTLKDLHDLQTCMVLGKEAVQMKTTPVAGSYPASLIRESTLIETYTIEYKEPSWFATSGIQCVPYYMIQGWNSATTSSKSNKTEVVVDYSKYKHNGGVDVSLGVMYLTPWNTTDYSFENQYKVEVQVFYDIADECENCHITPVKGEFSVLKGEDFTFKIEPAANYTIAPGKQLDVVVEPADAAGQVTWNSSANTYKISDIKGDIKIYVQKGENGPTGQLYFKLDQGADKNPASRYKSLGTVEEGESYTLLTPAEYRLTIPNNYTFVKWVVTTPVSSFGAEPGDSFKLNGAGDVIISPKYKNLYNIQVINGKAYKDEAHTQPLSNAVDEQRVYIVADEPEAGKVFWRWDVIEGYFNGVYDWDAAETSYYVNMGDALLKASYATRVDEVTLTILNEAVVPEAGMQVPVIEKVNRDAYGFYTVNYYDVTDGGHKIVFPDIENFQVGHTYQMETEVLKVDGYLLADLNDLTLHIEGLSENLYESVEMLPVSGYENERYKIIIRFPEIKGAEGVTVSGTITSSGSEGALVEVTLTKTDNEKVSYIRLLMGNSTTYSMNGVLPGTYTLRVTKAGHETCEYTVVVGEEAVTQDVTLKLASYTVSFAANGGTGTMAAVSRPAGEYTLPECGFTAPDGKKFKAWSVHGSEKKVGDKVSVYGDITITAVWEENSNTLFADVSPGSWQYTFVKYAYEHDLMKGKGESAEGKITFDPNRVIPREEFVQVLYNASGKPTVDIENMFPDVKDAWYKNAVLWAKANNIANGNGKGYFGVTESINRQDLALMLYKYAKLKGYDLTANTGEINRYADGNKVNSYAKTAMDWAITKGIMSGKGKKGEDISTFRLDPAGTATRAECAAMLKNFMDAFEK